MPAIQLTARKDCPTCGGAGHLTPRSVDKPPKSVVHTLPLCSCAMLQVK